MHPFSCHRLTKDCQPATFVRKRGVKKPARKSQLEDKLDSLVSLLQAQNTPQNAPNPTTATPPAFYSSRNPQPLPYTDEPSIPTPRSNDERSQLRGADWILDTFRTRYIPYYPFIHIPRNTTAEQFQRDRPWTWKAICVVCEGPRSMQNVLGAEFAREVTALVVAEGERSLDLLTSLVICTSWQFYFTLSKPCVGLFLGIVRSLVIYLRLDRPLNTVLARPKMPAFPDISEVIAERTDEERRIVLACFSSFAM
jgi:hypothetical protein